MIFRQRLILATLLAASVVTGASTQKYKTEIPPRDHNARHRRDPAAASVT